jgi:hypothetical protein
MHIQPLVVRFGRGYLMPSFISPFTLNMSLN